AADLPLPGAPAQEDARVHWLEHRRDRAAPRSGPLTRLQPHQEPRVQPKPTVKKAWKHAGACPLGWTAPAAGLSTFLDGGRRGEARCRGKIAALLARSSRRGACLEAREPRTQRTWMSALRKEREPTPAAVPEAAEITTPSSRHSMFRLAAPRAFDGDPR